MGHLNRHISKYIQFESGVTHGMKLAQERYVSNKATLSSFKTVDCESFVLFLSLSFHLRFFYILVVSYKYTTNSWNPWKGIKYAENARAANSQTLIKPCKG